MEHKIDSLRKMYEEFRRGKMEAEAVRDEARLVLKEAEKRGDSKVSEEAEDILMELGVYIGTRKCG